MNINQIKQFVEFKANNPQLLAEAARIFQFDRQNNKKIGRMKQQIRNKKRQLITALQQRKRFEQNIHRQLNKINQQQVITLNKIQLAKANNNKIKKQISLKNQEFQARLKQNQQIIQQLQLEIEKQEQQFDEQSRKLQLQIALEQQSKIRAKQSVNQKQQQANQCTEKVKQLKKKRKQILKLKQQAQKIAKQNQDGKNNLKLFLQSNQKSIKQNAQKQQKQKLQKQQQMKQFVDDLNRLIKNNQIQGLEFIISTFYLQMSRQEISKIQIPQSVRQQLKQKIQLFQIQQNTFDYKKFQQNVKKQMEEYQQTKCQFQNKINKLMQQLKIKQQQINKNQEKYKRINDQVQNILMFKKK